MTTLDTSKPSATQAYSTPPANSPIAVERWPSELPLLALCIVVSIGLWIVAVVSVVGLAYAAMLALFFFVLRLSLVAHLRGSSIKLGPEQFPDLHARVAQFAGRMGMDRVPDTYIMQSGGALNAFAMRFLGANFVVLFSQLLDACGDDEAARDMIIAHELGHIHAGHVRLQWLIIPAGIVPFLGTALSRAREYTCDRYGLAGAGNSAGAVRGLTILAAGPNHAARVNLAAFARQHADINTGLMTIGEWFGTHPPLTKRIAQLDPALATHAGRSRAGAMRAAAILLLVLLPVVIGGYLAASKFAAMIATETAKARAAAKP
jgi:Zn-dependent protease with chaperone function